MSKRKDSKDKGNRGERKALEAFRAAGLEVRRYLQYNKSWDDPDLGVIVGDRELRIEVKNIELCSDYWFDPEKVAKRESPPSTLLKWLGGKEDETPYHAVVFTKNYKPYMAFYEKDGRHIVTTLEEYAKELADEANKLR